MCSTQPEGLQMINNEEQRYSQLELALAKAKRDSSRLDSLEKLVSMDEFKDVFTDGIMGEYAEEIFQQLTTPKTYATVTDNYDDKLKGIAFLKSCLGYVDNNGMAMQGEIYQKGMIARRNIPELLKDLEG